MTVSRLLALGTLAMGLALASIGVAAVARQGTSAASGSQEEAASKTARFGFVSSKSADLKKALDSKDLAGGLKLNGKIGSFVGVVDSVYAPRAHRQVFLDFSRSYKSSITAKIFQKDFSKFPSLNSLKGKRVLVTGKFSSFMGTHPEVSVDSPESIRIVR